MEHFFGTIHGFFNFPGFYRSMIEHFDSGAHFVELGVYRGTSLAFLVVEIMNYEKDIEVTAVDLFGLEWKRCKTYPELFDEFQENLSPVADRFNVLRMETVEAATHFEDESLDFVYIDADHSYPACSADIEAYLPKMKPGGIIAGHDWFRHTVQRAVFEHFGSPIWVAGQSWWHQVPGGDKKFTPDFGEQQHES